MAQINYAEKSISCKVVYYGPGVSGKTTNLQIIYEKTSDNNKGNLVSLKTEGDRTLYFDFLPLDLGQIKGFKTKFQLYTVPGQIYYNATRKLVLKGVDAVVFVADSSTKKREENIESLSNLVENLQELNLTVVDDIPLVIQYNKRDLPEVMTIEEMKKDLNTWNVPDFEAVAVESIGVFKTLKSIATLFIQGFHEKYGFEIDIDESEDEEETLTSTPAKSISIEDEEDEKIEIETHSRLDSIDLSDEDTNDEFELQTHSRSEISLDEDDEIETTNYSDSDFEIRLSNEQDIDDITLKEEADNIKDSFSSELDDDFKIDLSTNSKNEEISFDDDIEISSSNTSEKNILENELSGDDISNKIKLSFGDDDKSNEKEDDILLDDEDVSDNINDEHFQNDVLKAKLELESKKNANVTLKNKTVGAPIKKPTAPKTGNIVNKGTGTFIKRKKKKSLMDKISSIFKK